MNAKNFYRMKDGRLLYWDEDAERFCVVAKDETRYCDLSELPQDAVVWLLKRIKRTMKADKAEKAEKAKKSKAFLDEAFGFIDICGAKPRFWLRRDKQASPAFIYRGTRPRSRQAAVLVVFISTHTSLAGRDYVFDQHLAFFVISTHAPTKGATTRPKPKEPS